MQKWSDCLTRHTSKRAPYFPSIERSWSAWRRHCFKRRCWNATRSLPSLASPSLRKGVQLVVKALEASHPWALNTKSSYCQPDDMANRYTIQERETAMNIEHFTEKAREAVSDAAQLARQFNHNQVEVEHLLAALLAQEGGLVPQVIAKVGGNLLTAQRTLNTELERMPHVYGG